MNKKIAVSLLLIVCFLPLYYSFGMELNWPNSPAGTPLNDTSDLTMFVQYVYEWGIALGGLAAFVSLVIAGFQYLTSVGDPTKMSEAKGRATSAVFGLVLLLGSWLILNTINPDLTSLTPISLDTNLEMPDLCQNNNDCQNPALETEEELTSPTRVVYECIRPVGANEGTCQPKNLQYTCEYAVVCQGGVNASERVMQEYNSGHLGPNSWYDLPGGGECCGLFGGRCERECYKVLPGDWSGNNRREFCGITSVAAVFNDTEVTHKYYPCKETGCGCTLQLLHEGFLSWGCGDMIGVVPAWDDNLPGKTDRPIKCVELQKPPFAND